MSHLNKWIDIYLHLSQHLNNKPYDQKFAHTDCRHDFSGHFPIKTIELSIQLRKWRDTGKPIPWSQIRLCYRYIFRLSSIALSHLIVSKSRYETNCRTFVPKSFCFFVKYLTIIINGVIDYRVFRYRLKVSISHLLLTRAKI